jgi:hypothetical protein
VIIQDVDILVDGISSTCVPVIFNPLLCRYQLDKLIEFTTQKTPPTLHMEDQGVSFILGENADLAYPGVNAVGEGEIDNPEFPTKRYRRLGTPLGQIFQS